jgi:hypothetical protein
MLTGEVGVRTGEGTWSGSLRFVAKRRLALNLVLVVK